MEKRKLLTIVLIILVYIISCGISYALFSKSSLLESVTSPVGLPVKGGEGKLVFDPNLPKTESCPLNGVLYSKQQKKWWEEHRPLGIMIENHQEARPQSGLSSADVIYEAVAEGGITRFLAVYFCQDGAQIGFPVFWRDYDRLGHPVATEHTMYSTSEKLWEYAKSSRGLTEVDKKGTLWSKGFVPYSFKEDASSSKRGTTKSIHLEFWSSMPDYFTDWVYDPLTNLYKRSTGKKIQVDKNTNKQLTSKNIVVLFMQERNANDGYENNVHLLYRTKGTGKAEIFMDGKQIKGAWRKDSRTARILLFDSTGAPVEFNRGLIWFEILPTDGVVTVK